jgi:hypothetical protein
MGILSFQMLAKAIARNKTLTEFVYPSSDINSIMTNESTQARDATLQLMAEIIMQIKLNRYFPPNSDCELSISLLLLFSEAWNSPAYS